MGRNNGSVQARTHGLPLVRIQPLPPVNQRKPKSETETVNNKVSIKAGTRLANLRNEHGKTKTNAH
jgi:hypothetical protein